MKIAGIVLLIFLCIVVLYIFLLAVSALAVDAKREYRKDSGYYRFLLYLSTAVSMRIVRIHIHATGIEKIPAGGRFVLVSNHRPKFDPIVTWHVLRRYQLAFISKEENFHIPIFGRIIRKCCFMAIDCEDPRKALTTINAASMYEDSDVRVIESTTIGEGFAELSMFSTEFGDADSIASDMADGMEGTVTAMVSRSIRDTADLRASHRTKEKENDTWRYCCTRWRRSAPI